MTSSERQALLGRLVYELGWLTRQGEPTATRALALLLNEEPLLRSATLSFLGGLTGRALDQVQRFEAERVHEDSRRADLEGLDSWDRPVLIVEAKFAAAFGEGQIRDYLSDQTRRLAEADGALVLLVPADRTGEARRVLDVEEGTHGLGVAVVTWSEWFDCWEQAIADQPGGLRSIAADLVQLRDMCSSLGGFVIEPLAGSALGPAWRDREGDLRDIVPQVTVALNAGLGALPPMVHTTGYDPARYAPAGNHTWLSVGVASLFADRYGSPIWVRFHKRTPRFKEVKSALLATGYRTDAQHNEGHLWIPLRIDADLAGPELVANLIGQVVQIQDSIRDAVVGH